MLAKKAGVSFLILLIVFFAGQSALAELFDYTTDADFDEGTLVDVNHDPPNNNQLQLDTTETPFAFVNVAATAWGTIVRINADNGDIIGEYRTAPGNLNSSPSRTAVDSFGNVWTANIDEAGALGGSVVKIGILVGGIRVSIDENGDVIEDDNGDYLQGPFDYSTCIDRDGDDLIRTSLGLGDILSWPDITDGEGGTVGIVEDAQDECILVYQRLANAPNAYHVSTDADNNVWVGGYPSFTPAWFYKLNGDSGAVMATFNAGEIGCGGWGGLVDDNGVLWSAGLNESKLMFYDTINGTSGCIPVEFSYGLGVDSLGFIWNSSVFDSTLVATAIVKINSSNFSIEPDFPKATSDDRSNQGVAITPADDNVWVAQGGGSEVARLNNIGEVVKRVTLPNGKEPTGVAVDAFGNVWVTNLTTGNVMRINPSGGLEGNGEVDLTVNLGIDAAPDNYSNMTGVVPFSETAAEGTWTVITDSDFPGHSWDTIIWNTEPEASEPDGTSITVEARAADSQDGLADEDYIEISNDVPFSLTGQFIEIRATLMANDAGISPVLSNLAVDVKTAPERGEVCDVDENGIIDFRDIKGIFYSFGDTADGPDDPRDWDRDGMITKIDAKGCIRECTDPHCGFQESEEPCLEGDRQTEKHLRSKERWYPTKRWRGQLYRKAERH